MEFLGRDDDAQCLQLKVFNKQILDALYFTLSVESATGPSFYGGKIEQRDLDLDRIKIQGVRNIFISLPIGSSHDVPISSRNSAREHHLAMVQLTPAFTGHGR